MAKKNAESKTTATQFGKGTPFPHTRKRFLEVAKPVAIKIGESTLVAGVKEFKFTPDKDDPEVVAGTLGYFLNDKVVIEIDGVPTKFQAQISLFGVNSKKVKE